MKKGRVVVVDDEENIRAALKDILTDEGYDVDCAPDGESALRMIQSETPDVVLLDIWMPGLDGLQTLKILKNIDADTEVVMMSGHGAIETAVKATKIGALDFIEKPFSLDTILRAVGKAVRSRRSRFRNGGLPSLQGGVAVEGRFMGSSRAAKEARRLIREAAQSHGPALIIGEPGLGKRFAARMIHNLSSRREKPFLEIQCESFTAEDLNSLITGAKSGGRMDLSTGGSVFLDKLGMLDPKLSASLAEFLGAVAFNADTRPRLIASVEMEPDSASAENNKPLSLFTGDAATTTIRLQPLRNRKNDIQEFVERFLDEICDEYGKHLESVDGEAMELLTTLPWPGNIRELKRVMEQAVLVCDGPVLMTEHVTTAISEEGGMGRQGLGVAPRKISVMTGKGKSSLTRQRTLKNSVVLCGQGLHSGIKTGMILSPLPTGSGIVFGDISTGSRVPALLENVHSTEYATTLTNGHVTIKTIEHIMSALHSYRITNLLIKIGDEAPIMDGSAIDFCQLIEDSGIEEQDGSVEEIVIEDTICVGDMEDGPGIMVEPAPGFSVHYMLAYPPPLGAQEYEYSYESGAHYRETIAPARTFGFVRDIQKLEEAGLAGGGKLSNFILIDDEKIVNTPLRFPNEPARHKILDLIGDLYLLGRPIRGRFIARKSGHTQNIGIIKKIRERMGASGAFE
ncbi:MAG: UDP-3-O-[3-hydroxymyristoyl] N-acetylglucosamine deacetylase [Nitrospinae bacterium]|nr:UDP-3-O-[3-hydroxymyristoyl] N-acetylglucosamine deacetylase [Nitrospinota bacterium]